MKYLIYKITNKINGKFYIGCHVTENINDNYLGSGIAIKRAIKKYGKQNFAKEILFTFDNMTDMHEKEKILIKENIGNVNCYNLTEGGRGSFYHINSNRKLYPNPMTHDKNVVSKLVAKLKNKFETDEEYRKMKISVAIQNLKHATEKNKGKKRPKHSKFMAEWAKNNWVTNKESIRDSLSSYFVLTSPDGKIYKTNRLQDFCEENNLTYVSVWASSKTHKPVSKGKSKGWKCEIYE